MGIFLGALPLSAAEGTVTYGSEKYGWYTGEVSVVSVCLNSEVSIGSYEICLEFDDEILEYKTGATSCEGNRIYIQGTGIDKSYKTTLQFVPIKTGNTEIEVVSVKCTSVADARGNVEMVEIKEVSIAPVTVYQSISKQLAKLEANSMSPIPILF